MTEQNSADDRLLEELKNALSQADPVPEDVLEAAKTSFTWRTIDAELAALEFDSAIQEVAGVRGDTSTRHLLFKSPDAELEIEFRPSDRTMTGQLAPAQHATVELMSADGALTVETDESGSFEFTDVPTGPVKLHCALHDGTTFTTEWTLL